MGQKTHPKGFRLGVIRTWDAAWYADKHYADWLHEDIALRKFLRKKLQSAGVSRIEISRGANKVQLRVFTPRPGIVIGKKGSGVEGLRRELQAQSKSEVSLSVHEIRKAELDAQLVAENVAMQLQRRVAFRRAMKKAVQTALKFGAKGIRIACKGRLGGREMSRHEWYREGRVPLHTLRADIDYGLAEAKTSFGIIGVKCWIFKGEILPGSAVGVA
jgi:small subunit ribosomal protein S3